MLDKIITLAEEAGEIALSAENDRSFVTKEGRANFVTEYDSRIQAFLVGGLKKLIPDALFVCEENDFDQGWDENRYRFVIDPIDGTTNFIHNFAYYAVCIGLMRGDEQILGVVHCPAIETTYFAEKGKGAFVRRHGVVKQIHTSDSGLDNAVIMAGTAPYHEELLTKSYELARSLLSRAADTRRTGSAAIDICLVAEGTFDLMFECLLSPWDYTAAAIILTEAGGKFCDFGGNRITRDARVSFVAGSAAAVDQFTEFCKANNF